MDSSNIDFIVKNFYSQFCALSYRYVGRVDYAQDVVQEVLVSLWQRMDSIDLDRSKYYSYIKSAIIKHSLKFVRDNNIKFCQIESDILELETATMTFCESIEVDARLKGIMERVDKLSPQSHVIFNKIVFDNKQYREVAEELNISINTVKTQYKRALHKLRLDQEDIIMLLIIMLSR